MTVRFLHGCFMFSEYWAATRYAFAGIPLLDPLGPYRRSNDIDGTRSRYVSFSSSPSADEGIQVASKDRFSCRSAKPRGELARTLICFVSICSEEKICHACFLIASAGL